MMSEKEDGSGMEDIRLNVKGSAGFELANWIHFVI